MAHITLVGRVGKEPEKRYSANGNAVLTFSVAESFYGKDRDGNFTESTDWHNVVIFGKYADTISEKIGKGSLVTVFGDQQAENYEKDGQKRTSRKIVASKVVPHQKLETTTAPAASDDVDLSDLPFS